MIITALIFGYSVKQSIITLPLMLFLYYLFGLPLQSPVIKWLNKWKYALGLLILISLGLLFYKLLSDERFLIGPSKAGEVIGRKNYMLSQPGVVIFYYLKLLLFPINLNIDPDLSKEAFTSKFFLAICSILIIFLLAWMSRFRRLFLFLTLWFFIILAPSSSIITLLDLAAEHRVYLASLGLFTMFSMSIAMIYRSFLKVELKPHRMAGILIGILIVFTLRHNY